MIRLRMEKSGICQTYPARLRFSVELRPALTAGGAGAAGFERRRPRHGSTAWRPAGAARIAPPRVAELRKRISAAAPLCQQSPFLPKGGEVPHHKGMPDETMLRHLPSCFPAPPDHPSDNPDGNRQILLQVHFNGSVVPVQAAQHQPPSGQCLDLLDIDFSFTPTA